MWVDKNNDTFCNYDLPKIGLILVQWPYCAFRHFTINAPNPLTLEITLSEDTLPPMLQRLLPHIKDTIILFCTHWPSLDKRSAKLNFKLLSEYLFSKWMCFKMLASKQATNRNETVGKVYWYKITLNVACCVLVCKTQQTTDMNGQLQVEFNVTK